MSNVSVEFRLLHKNAKLPVKATPGSACFDIFADLIDGNAIQAYDHNNTAFTQIVSGHLVVRPGERVLIPTGWAVRIPPTHSMRIFSRSGLTLKQGLVVANGEGVVDADYRQEVYVMLTNIGSRWIPLTNGAKIAQLDFQEVHSVECKTFEGEPADWFNTERTGGFGSTGV